VPETAELVTEDVVTTEPGPESANAAAIVEEDLLVEDVSIDGMCGVY
jgi:mycofactocin precursor